MGEVKLEYPGVIFACTDGLTDVTNEMGAYFDDARIGNVLQGAAQYISASLLNEALITEMDIFRGTRPYPDDIAMLSLKYVV